MSDEQFEHYESVRKKLNEVSPSFCLAKWTQVTLHLQTGMTHSCHHPAPHKIPFLEALLNPSAIHNTKHKKKVRQQMLKGERPKECDYCWNVEDSGGQNWSDRVYKSSEPWALEDYENIKCGSWKANAKPRYLEVSFSHACNFKCSYCGPQFSSSWMKEVKKSGAYPTSGQFNNLEYLQQTKTVPVPLNQPNIYVDAFWKWWPEVFPQLKVFRITGGEPLMSPDALKVLDYIYENPNPDLEFGINSNLGSNDKLIQQFVEKASRLEIGKHLKKFEVFTSVDTWGEQAAYIRSGMIWDKFWHNVHRVLDEIPQAHLIFMCTFNALSLPQFKKFLENILQLKKTYRSEHRPLGVYLDTPYIRYPEHQTVRILPPEYGKYFEECLEYMQAHPLSLHEPGFEPMEVERIKRIYEWFKTPVEKAQQDQWRQDFYRFFKAHDERRNTDFKKTFPEMNQFWNLCEDLAQPTQ